MIGRNRVSGRPDVGRMSALLARPGIDTRLWVSFAYANAESVVSDKGVYVDVTLAPAGNVVTAQVSSDYAGPSFGSYRKIHQDDELLVGFPDGDMNHGGIVLRMLWSRAYPPPSEAISGPDDVIDRIEDGKTYRDITSGAGKRYIKSDAKVIADSPAVHLGGEDPFDAIILGTTYRAAQNKMDVALAGFLTTAGASLTTAGGSPPLTGTPAGTAILAAGAALTSAAGVVTAFDSSPTEYLSQIGKIK